MKKKLLLTLITAFVGLFSFGVINASAATYGDLEYKILDGEVTITGCDMNVASVTIPKMILGYPVTKIASSAFSGYYNLTSISIHEGITSIEPDTFSDCINLTDISFSDHIVSIGNYAFRNCSSLTSISVPASVMKIGNGAFWGCSSLTSVSLSNGITSIGTSTFRDCSSLTDISIPDCVMQIYNFAFQGCSSLNSVVLGDNVRLIAANAFKGCNSLSVVRYKGTENDWNEMTINSGNDCLKTANIIFLPNTQTTISADSKSFTVKPVNVEIGKTVILALYNYNEFVEAQTRVYNGEDIPFTTDKTFTNVKIMVWDNLESRIPVCDAEEI